MALARALIGVLLVRVLDRETLVARIVETEAYHPGDPASHAYRGETQRNRAMFGPPLHAYVYFIYGANWCLNVTSEEDGIGAAVLIRACEPVQGVATMRRLRGREVPDAHLLRGPGNVCRGMGIDGRLDGIDLMDEGALRLAGGQAVGDLGTSTRIGLSRAASEPLRFYARGSPSLSGRRSLSP